MKLIKPSFEIIEQLPGLEGIYKQIELAGRTCYKSFDKITEDSAKPFVDRMMSKHHLSVLEHGTVYLAIPHDPFNSSGSSVFRYRFNPYSKVANNFLTSPGLVYITSNYRVLVENNWLDDLQYLCEPTEFHEKRVTVRMICSIGTSRELNRHRANSISEQSTRYCNFSKDKFGNEVSFIIPSWLPSYIEEGRYATEEIHHSDGHIEVGSTLFYKEDDWVELSGGLDDLDLRQYIYSLCLSENNYFKLLKLGWKPQQAREVLPLATATEVVYTAYISDWINFFRLRCSEAAHPSARELAIPLKEEFIKRGYI